MIDYKIAAFDMDGTLLTSKQTISPNVKKAIDETISKGKNVVVCTGRSLMELNDYKKDFESVRYYICENGAYIFDKLKEEVLYINGMSTETVEEIIKSTEPEDSMMVFAINGQNMLSKNNAVRMGYFFAERYQDVELRTAIMPDSIIDYYRSNPVPVEKINIYSRSVENRDRIYERLKNLPLKVMYAEDTGLEIIDQNTSKGIGYERLCKMLDIPMEETIGVGDSDNDIDMLKASGLGVAMRNARKCIIDISDVVVADNDNDGCAEVLIKYM